MVVPGFNVSLRVTSIQRFGKNCLAGARLGKKSMKDPRSVYNYIRCIVNMAYDYLGYVRRLLMGSTDMDRKTGKRRKMKGTGAGQSLYR
jgi:hypothetical protein